MGLGLFPSYSGGGRTERGSPDQVSSTDACKRISFPTVGGGEGPVQLLRSWRLVTTPPG